MILMFVLMLPACTNEEEKKEVPTPTSVTTGYTGPFISSNTVQEGCTEGGCGGAVSQMALVEAALPLQTQTIAGFTLGIPEGYSPIVFDEEVVISATSVDTIGGFTIVLRKISDLQEITARFEQADFESGTPIKNPTLTGTRLPNKQVGTIALLQTEEGQMIFVEGFASPGYWPAFTVTFDAMLETITLTP